MLDTHVYEVLPGEVIFRRSGNAVRRLKRCRMVVTRVLNVREEGDTWVAEISVMTSGYEHVRLPTWFETWSQSDNLQHGGNFQSGRPVTIAIGEREFELMLRSGVPAHDDLGAVDDRSRPYQGPVVAVLIDGQWVEPISNGR